MAKQRIECLKCGRPRALARTWHRVEGDECPRCGYLGWAPSDELTETTRRALRERSVEARRLRAVA
jgi:Zn ribbon nucleic-acid-binding protein